MNRKSLLPIADVIVLIGYKLLVFGFLVLGTVPVFGQISSKDAVSAGFLEKRFAATIDSTITLTDNRSLTYSSDSLFKCIHFTDAVGAVHLIDIRYKEDNRGYVTYAADFNRYLLFASRGQGSGNPIYLLLVDKTTGSLTYPGLFPIHIDNVNEVIVFETDKNEQNHISIRNFRSGAQEDYPLPHSNPCVCCECWIVKNINRESLILQYYDIEDVLQEITFKRKR